MYVPPHYRAEGEVLASFIRAAEFGQLVSVTGKGEPWVTHVPVLCEQRGDEWWVETHLARANPQGREVDDSPVLVVLPGPGAYVSPAWYTVDEVPTWNYLAVHLRGRAERLEGEAFRQSLARLVARHESGRTDGKLLEEYDEDMIAPKLRAAVGLRIRVERLDGAFKLSQEQETRGRQQVATALAEQGGEAARIAAAMHERERDD